MEQNRKKCPYCGKEILSVAKKCKYCGEWLYPANNVTRKKSVVCPCCAEEIEEGLKICPLCNEPLGQNEKAHVSQPKNTTHIEKEAKKKQKIKPIWYIVAFIFCFCLGGYLLLKFDVLENPIEKLISDVLEEPIEALIDKSENIFKDNAENTTKENKIFNYEGLSFSYPENWKIKKEVILEDFSFQVSCEEGFYSSDLIIITWIRTTDITALEAIENNIEAMKEMEMLHAKVGTLYNSTFKGQSSLSVDYTTSIMDEICYCTITSFIMNGNVVSIIKQSDSKKKLDTEFKQIEESFNIDIY
jgi:hypothetical protein